MAKALPEYVRSSLPNPQEARAPWYKNTAPAYAGIFLWVAFYVGLSQPNGMAPPLSQASIGVCVLALLVAGLICFGLYYYVPAMLGMKTGRPLYVVATSTFGTSGGYVMPGLMMGLLQVGWYAVATSVSSSFILQGLHKDPASNRGLFVVIALCWAFGLAAVALKGINYVAKAAQVLNWVPLAMIVIVFAANFEGVSRFEPAVERPGAGFLTILTVVLGYFATAGAAGADFGMNSRNRGDVIRGGLTGIVLAILVAGALPLMAVAGYVAKSGAGPVDYSFTSTIASVGSLSPLMFFLFAAASLAPTCFCCFVISTCFKTMLPRISSTVSTLVGVSIAALLAITGVAGDLVGFFVIVGASFGPICGAMAADYLFSGRRWAGPRLGVNWPGVLAWAFGFLVGIADKLPGVPRGFVELNQPSVLWSFVVGFGVYYALAKLGLSAPLASSDAPSLETTSVLLSAVERSVGARALPGDFGEGVIKPAR